MKREANRDRRIIKVSMCGVSQSLATVFYSKRFLAEPGQGCSPYVADCPSKVSLSVASDAQTHIKDTHLKATKPLSLNNSGVYPAC